MTQVPDYDAVGRILTEVSERGLPPPIGSVPAITGDAEALRWRRRLARRISWAWTHQVIAAGLQSNAHIAGQLSGVEVAAGRLRRHLEGAGLPARQRLATALDQGVSELIDVLDELETAARAGRAALSEDEAAPALDGSASAFVRRLADVFREAYENEPTIAYGKEREPIDGPFVAFVAAAVKEMSSLGSPSPMKPTPGAIAQALKPSRARRGISG